jgi:acetyl esterase/lipase
MDPLRDEEMIFERVLRENGTKTKMNVYPGVSHGFWSFFPTMELSKQFVKDTVAGVGWLLELK